LKEQRRSQLSVEYLPIDTVKPYPQNARIHTRHQVRQIAESIKVFGFTNPVLIDRNNLIIAGHGRVAAAKLLGMTLVPTIRLEGLTEEQIRAYVIADNRLAEKAGWDNSILAIELQHLITIENNFDVTITGFEVHGGPNRIRTCDSLRRSFAIRSREFGRKHALFSRTTGTGE
jgi:hypothetical protein